MSTAIADEVTDGVARAAPSLQRRISWTGAFWVASGVPAFLLFTIGGVAATVGKASWLVWTVSITFVFIQSFTYAEIAGLFPGKSGGASIHSAIAWIRYVKILAPISVWCNWFSWSVVLSMGAGLGAGYVINLFFSADAAINTWQIVLVDLGSIKEGMTLRVNATFIVGAALLLTCFAIQRGGILRSARVTMVLGVAALVPLILIGIVPLLTGDLPRANFVPLVPLAHDASGQLTDGAWDKAGWLMIFGGLFAAAWSTHGFETATCYTREFKDPKRDTFKAIFYSGLLCLGVFILVPLAFQGSLGVQGMLAPDIYSGMGVGRAMAEILDGGVVIETVITVLLILALMLCIMTSMSGASRTSYQGSVEGWLPRYLSHVNATGAPTRGMWTDLSINLVLLLMSDYLFILAATNVAYVFFTFLHLNAGWIHRLDRSHWQRAYRAPNIVFAIGVALSFVNIALIGLGAHVWGANTLYAGIFVVLLGVPVFLFRHYVQDKGQYPQDMVEDMQLGDEVDVSSRAGTLPYLTLGAAALIVLLGHLYASS